MRSAPDSVVDSKILKSREVSLVSRVANYPLGGRGVVRGGNRVLMGHKKVLILTIIIIIPIHLTTTEAVQIPINCSCSLQK